GEIVGSQPAEETNELASVAPRSLVGMIGLQFLIAIYGGYFGAGIGILMLSGLGMMGLTNIHQMNGLKSVLATAINGIAAVIFVAQGKVVWPFALAMMATSIVGGYLAAHFSRQIPGKYVRWFVIVVGFSLAAFFFWKQIH
ncbi:MAG: sulfite exporter TauE/SafE family protein, partial [Pirellulaceae bacterium]|nr:sulfite exporter TauE/SafE family protein [Pirellulaceae bacterium]